MKVLDKGSIELIDVMGDDQAIVDAARVSIGSAKAAQSNEALIRFLMRHRHTSPFEMVVFKFRVKCPIFVAREWATHRTTASWNEISGRYAELPAEWYVPEPERIQKQATDNKQGSGGLMDDADQHVEWFNDEAKDAFSRYRCRLVDGMARELARDNLPLSTYTEFVYKQDLHNLFHFLSLRSSPAAQYEIRVYAEAIQALIQPVVPLAYQSWLDYVKNAVTLTAYEVRALRKVLQREHWDCDSSPSDFPTKREHAEFLEKCARIVEGE